MKIKRSNSNFLNDEYTITCTGMELAMIRTEAGMGHSGADLKDRFEALYKELAGELPSATVWNDVHADLFHTLSNEMDDIIYNS